MKRDEPFSDKQEDVFEMICYTLFLFLPVWEMTGHGVWIESCMTAEGQLLIDRSSPHTRFQSENGRFTSL